MATWPATLPSPQLAGYALEASDQTVRTDMDGGAARVRRRATAAPDRLTLRFTFSEAQMVIFRGFWETGFLHGAGWVVVPVKTGRATGVESKECRPKAGVFKAALLSNAYWSVEIEVEVRNA